MPRTTFPTAFGTCALSWSEAGLTSFHLPEAPLCDSDVTALPPEIERLISRVQRHLAGEPQDFANERYAFESVSSFNAAVYQAALAVKSGQTCSYGEIARAMGQPAAVSRGVGAALGANPWPLLVPCHRVVAADGRMTGFSGPGGIKTKLRLLALEGAQLFAE
jgi:methylated-DNA-[protein]-cysteine S-methyltransferase